MRYNNIHKRLTKVEQKKAIQEQQVYVFYDKPDYEQWKIDNSPGANDLVICVDYGP